MISIMKSIINNGFFKVIFRLLSYFCKMKPTRFYIILLLVIATISSCKKEEEPLPQPTEFTFSANDSLVFEHSGTLPYSVAVQCSLGKEFISSFSGLFDSFSNGGTTIAIPSNEIRSFNISFNQFGVNPGVYPCTLSVAVPNENNALKTKVVQMVYRPNCGYAFRNYTIGQITFLSNGILLNKNISCAYNTSGQLVVSGLTTFDVILNFNCANNTVTMEPEVINGFLTTGSGQIEGTEIALQMYSDGALHSNARIKF